MDDLDKNKTIYSEIDKNILSQEFGIGLRDSNSPNDPPQR
jgi:hypothetical protein